MPQLENVWQYAAAAAGFVIVLILLIWLLRRAGSAVRTRRGDRLAILETRSIDKIRHLVLVQCDEEEHLLLIGGPTDVLVKANVGADIYEAAEYQSQPYDVADVPNEPAFDLPREPIAPALAVEKIKPAREGYKSRFATSASSADTDTPSSRFASRNNLLSTSTSPSLKRDTPRPKLSSNTPTRRET